MFTPPARSDSEAEGLWPRLASASLTHISSDHAPSTVEQKRKGMDNIWNCPFGLPGDFLIAPSGRIKAVKYGTHAYDQWSVDELIRLANGAALKAA